MSLYNGPPRAGARGGASEFSWENVKADKDRDYYIGHSVKASVGRWQKNRDILWYTRDAKDNQQSALADEIAAVKQREADLMAEALGLKPKMLRTNVTARLDKQEMDALLKQGSGAAEDGGDADPDRVHGLGFATWENVKADKDRDYYIGHSVKASVGRWQKNRDILWYTRDAKDNQQSALADEIAAVKQREADLMAEALGLKPKMLRTNVTARLDKQEMDALLKQGSGAAEDGGDADPDRVHGLGFATAPLGALSEAVHETLQGVGMGTGATAAVPGPLPAAGTGGASTSYPPPPPMGLMTAQQLEELAKQDKRAAKAAKKAGKAEKKAKKKEHKKHKKHKGNKHRSRSRSPSRSPSTSSRSRSRSKGRDRSRGGDERRQPDKRRAASPSRHQEAGNGGRHGSMREAEAYRGVRHEKHDGRGRRAGSRERDRGDEAEPLARGHHDRHGDREGRSARDGGSRRHDSPDPHSRAGGGPRHSSRHADEAVQRERRRSPVRSRRHDSPQQERGGGSRRRHDSP